MIEGNLAWDIIRDIPWEDSPQYSFSRDSAKYYEAFQKVIDRIPEETGERINFFSDRWDFSPYIENVRHGHLIIRFDGLPDPLKRYCKFFCIHELMGSAKITTVRMRCGSFRSLVAGIVARNGHESAMTITTEDIIEEVRSRNVSPETEHALYLAAYKVLLFIRNNYRIAISADLDMLENLASAAGEISKANRAANKLSSIPDEYYEAVLGAAIGCMRDETCEPGMRATASMIVMLSQLGLRIGDLLGLKVGALTPYTLGNGAKAGFIRYVSQKPSKAHQPMLELETFSDPLCTEAFEALLGIRASFEPRADNDFLYVLDFTTDVERRSRNAPVSIERFYGRYKRFFATQLLDVCRQDWDGIGKCKTYVPNGVPVYQYQTAEGGRKKRIGSGHCEQLSIPDTRQFRVHVATSLYERGFSLAYIQRYMGHLSEYMMGYYVRPKDTYQESISYSEEIIREVVGERLNLVGGAFPTQLTAAIRAFVEADHRELATEIHNIANDMGKTIAIRAKPGGVCIKADGVLGCAKDGRTDQVLCLNGVCPNVYHTVSDTAVAYEDFKVMQQTYKENLDNGFTRQAQLELSKLKRKNKAILLPELNEMDNVIAERGEEWLVTRHPELLDVVSRRHDIREEVSIWMTK